MARARDMVAFAQSLNAKLQDPAKSAPGTSEEAKADEAVRRSLISLGLTTPAVTPEMARSEKEYHISLAKELGSVLLGSRSGRPPLMLDGKGKQGLLGLDEVWCLWNRARGVGQYPASYASVPLTLLLGSSDITERFQVWIRLPPFGNETAASHKAIQVWLHGFVHSFL